MVWCVCLIYSFDDGMKEKGRMEGKDGGQGEKGRREFENSVRCSVRFRHGVTVVVFVGVV